MPYFAIGSFLSAFLLFQIQPIIGKLLLPWFGGTPAVWSTVLLFFQVLLLAGYAYAYWLIGSISLRKQQLVHLTTLAVALIAIITTAIVWPSPITPDASWKPHTVDFPVGHIFILLTVSVALPYFLLATNAPLMQAWFSRQHPTRSPYPLYSISNMGSLLALISYPFFFEPQLSLLWQGKIWAIGFISFIVLTTFITGNLRHSPKIPITATANSAKPPTKIQCLWVLLAACAAILLMATTNQITQEIAAIPFLWLLPLTLYLLSFIITFSGENSYNRLAFSGLLAISYFLFVPVVTHLTVPLIFSISVYALLLFVCCMICHGELYKLKPNTSYLTRFYLMMAIGGALGGIFVNLLAPFIFKNYSELPLGITVCWLLLLTLVFLYPTALKPRFSWLYQAFILILTVYSCAFTAQIIYSSTTHQLVAVRNFYGIIRVQEIFADDPQKHSYLLTHGATLHGYQLLKPEKRRQTLGYYAPNTGVGLAITHHPRYGYGIKVGILGLGVGGLASYAKSDDTYRFYEINPAIIALAIGQGNYFHFLQDSSANIQIVLGDARLSLERELQLGEKQDFDVLAIDAFSSDAIPIHLLTKEAFAIYLAHLKPDGILAVHISNRNIDLEPVIWQVAKFYQLQALPIKARSDIFQLPSNWILLSHNTVLLSQLVALGHGNLLNDKGMKRVRLWTDDYSNLFQILK
jgi:hypothetical protein